MDEVRLIEVKEDILADNEIKAGEIRETLRQKKTFLLNLMSSPGSGKTSFIIKTGEKLKDRLRIGVIEADIDSKVDADKVAEAGMKAVQLKTGGFCHLDASMVQTGLDALDTENLDLIIIENVGNLVCPAEFDTGAARNIMILSIPEGDDKPIKYPLMFSVCNVLLVNKMDFLQLSDFDMSKMEERVRRLNPDIKIFPISCRTGEGIDAWIKWLENEIKSFVS